MARLTQLDDVLFPVEIRSVFAGVNETGEQFLSAPDKKAIVDTDKRRVVGIVGRAYRVVTNREALDWGYQCCQEVFPETRASEWNVLAAHGPASGGYCFMDLVHQSSELNFEFVPTQGRLEPFVPFVRVTNSYNGLRALKFDIGFFRGACTNGVIFYDSVVQFRFTHQRWEIRDGINFKVDRALLKKLRTQFGENLAALRSCTVHHHEVAPPVMEVLGIRAPKAMKPIGFQFEDWKRLEGHIGELCSRYFGELGENAYAAFNAITDFASHPPANGHVHRDRHSLQCLAGRWLSTFAPRCRDPGFNLTDYLTELIAAKAETSSSFRGQASGDRPLARSR